jgi:hypothetical protein
MVTQIGQTCRAVTLSQMVSQKVIESGANKGQMVDPQWMSFSFMDAKQVFDVLLGGAYPGFDFDKTMEVVAPPKTVMRSLRMRDLNGVEVMPAAVCELPIPKNILDMGPLFTLDDLAAFENDGERHYALLVGMVELPKALAQVFGDQRLVVLATGWLAAPRLAMSFKLLEEIISRTRCCMRHYVGKALGFPSSAALKLKPMVPRSSSWGGGICSSAAAEPEAEAEAEAVSAETSSGLMPVGWCSLCIAKEAGWDPDYPVTGLTGH